MSFYDSIPQQIRIHPDMDTSSALEILNALMGRFPAGSVAGEALFDAIITIEREIEESMKNQFAGTALDDAATGLMNLSIRRTA